MGSSFVESLTVGVESVPCAPMGIRLTVGEVVEPVELKEPSSVKNVGVEMEVSEVFWRTL